ncbi:PREDICTED: zinc finger protein 18-like [Elephantulus edwardii]|uniref:zinc finger protein 18-like n=1 Tax=Elephantulus edwardii TaxID=28737 RepID=UPI0003F0A18D|nr:PREDICTED: zinc finger protein 18-like [Elephantulus edwardii]
MPLKLGQALVQVPPLVKAEDPPLPGPSAAPQGELSSSEAAWQLFRGFQYQVLSGPHETLRQLRKLCFQWLQPEVHSKEQILELLILEQFLTILPGEIQMWVRTQRPSSGEEAVTLVESLKGDPRRLWQWIRSQVLGQERSPEEVKFASCQVKEAEASPEVVCQELGLQNSITRPGEHLSHIIKEEADTKPELGDRQENGKENLNLETCGDQKPPDAPCPISGEAPPQGSLSGFFGEDEQRCFGGDSLSKLQGHLQGEEREEQLSLQEKVPGKQQEQPVPDSHPRDLSVLLFKEKKEAPQKDQLRPPMIQKLSTYRECGESFHRNSQFLFDQKTHTGKIYFQCPTCKKEFLQQSHFVKHLRIHTGEKTWKCDHCGKGFRDFSELCHHEKIHTGEKLYKCPVCEKIFLHKSYFSRHQWAHTGEKPYKCPLCQKSFSYRSTLKRHQQVHTGEKTHKCALCEKSFSYKSSLKRHQEVHTGEKPYKCFICEKSFIRKSTLSIHHDKY